MNRPLRVLAVDDEAPALDELSYLLRAHERIGEVRGAGDANEALRLLRGSDFDAAFIDIRMPGLDGLELAAVLTRLAAPPALVFVTAHDDRAVDAFDLGAVDYLLKPLHADRLAETVRRVIASRESTVAGADNGEVIPVELAGSTTMLARADVRWAEAQGDYVRLHTGQASHLLRIPLAVLEEKWSEAGFVRIHRSYLVALRLIRELRLTGNGYVVRVDTGDSDPVELPVSRRHTRDLKDRLVRAAKTGWSRP